MARGEPAEIDWPRVLAENERWLRSVAYVRLHDWDAVHDVLQEVALAAVKQAAPLRDPQKAAPWLYQLTVRQTLLYRRKMGRRRRLVEQFIERAPPREGDTERDPLDWLLSRERARAVRTALEELPRRDAEILLLKYSENWSYQEIAERLGVSASAVESRLHRARAKLRERLLEYEPAGRPELAGERK